jgi:large subunit ribosomal protein L4
MASVTVRTSSGQAAGDVELDDSMFGIEPNVPVMHQVVTAQLAARRAGTHSTKTRAEVRGGSAKPYRQKGTGNARQGSTTSPHYSGGGVAHGPKPRSYAQRTPKKMIRLALTSALSDRARDGKVVVVDEWSFESPKTKQARAALDALGIDGKALIVLTRDEANAALSFRNLPQVHLLEAGQLNAYDVLNTDWVVFSRASLPGRSEGSTSDEVARGEGSTNDELARGAGSASDEPQSSETQSSEPQSSETGITSETSITSESSAGSAGDEFTRGEGSASDEPQSNETQSSETTSGGEPA